MGTWTTSRARGSCWPCWPSRTGSGPWPRSSWAPPPWPRWPSGGLLDGEAGKGYRVRTEALRQAAIPPPGQATQDDEEPGDAVLRRFIHRGRLQAMPAARGKRLVVLNHLAGLFEPGRRYPEPEVNELLGRYHPDYAMLRRYLVDDGFLDREDEPAPSGSRSVKVYWRTGGTVDLAAPTSS
jgi:hypothetical protein